MSATWNRTRDQPGFLRAIALDENEPSPISLPAKIREFVNMLLQVSKLFDSITRLYLSLGQDDNGQVAINSPSREIVEDLSEMELYSEDQVLHDFIVDPRE